MVSRLRTLIQRITVCAVIVLFFFLPSAGWAQQTDARGFEVKYQAQSVTIRVTRNVPLSELLEALCQVTKSRCEGTAATSNLITVPMTVSGPWNKVVSTLLEGTQLNYSSAAPSSSGGGSLIIGGHAAQISTPVAPPPVPFAPPNPIFNAPPEMARTDANGSTPAAPASVSPAPNMANPSLISQDGSGITDPHGLPIGIFGGPTVESMPDRAGNPIPVPPVESQSYEPMPDKNGNLIPVIIESQSYEPMPDKSGNLIPVNVPRRH